MPIIKSAIKRDRQQKKRRARNVMIKTGVKIKQKNAHKALVDDLKNAQEALIAAISEIDRAVKKGALHKNTAARKKSQLSLAYNKAADTPYGSSKTPAKKKPATKTTTTASKKAAPKTAAARKPAAKTMSSKAAKTKTTKK